VTAYGFVLYVIGRVAGVVQWIKARFRPVCVNPNCERGKPHYH